MTLGGDLDGDKYVVIFDQVLHLSSNSKPLNEKDRDNGQQYTDQAKVWCSELVIAWNDHFTLFLVYDRLHTL